MTPEEKIAALEAKIKEMTAMPGDVDRKKDSEAWLISTCVVVHERQHADFLSACTHPICRALSALANTIESMEERT